MPQIFIRKLTNLSSGPYLPVGQQRRPINILESTTDVFQVATFHHTHRTEKKRKLQIPRSIIKATHIVRRGHTPMGAMKTWSTTTLLKSAVKRVAPSLCERRGNLNSRYLFQRPMKGPKTCHKHCFTWAQLKALTYACPKAKKPNGAWDVVAERPPVVVFGCDLENDVWHYPDIYGVKRHARSVTTERQRRRGRSKPHPRLRE